MIKVRDMMLSEKEVKEMISKCLEALKEAYKSFEETGEMFYFNLIRSNEEALHDLGLSYSKIEEYEMVWC